MPANIGLQISLELSKILPIRSVVDTVGSQILKLARDLRLSGSDLVVEEDLAEVFGRGQINPELEAKFKDVVKIQNFVPLSKGCVISLESGPGPTMLHAFRDKRYFAMVIQVSLLAWTHSRQDLASMLSQVMTERFEMGVPEASPSPGIGGIISTLEACSSQSSAFSWAYYVQQVDSRFRASMTNYYYHSDHLRITRSLLLAAMDYLYIVQRFPEDRKITVSNEIGCITLIVWAHHVLGLTVAVIARVSNTQIVFGNDENPHVIITWPEINTKENAEQWWCDMGEDIGPEIRLLDSKMSVVLETTPEAEERLEIFTEDRHPLGNYGVTYLQRSFNTVVITSDDDLIYVEAATLATALAINADRRLDRKILKRQSPVRQDYEPEDQFSIHRLCDLDPDRPLPAASVEIWRILASAKLIFADIPLHAAKIDSYMKLLDETALDEDSCSPFDAFLKKLSVDDKTSVSTLDAFMEKVPIGDEIYRPANILLSTIQHLATVVLIFAHVSDVESCADLPIAFINPGEIQLTRVMSISPKERAGVDSRDIFSALAKFLGGKEFSNDDFQSLRHNLLFLYSNFGWSLFLDTVGDKDPGHVRPELVHIKKGTPTNMKTKERKSRIRDGFGCGSGQNPASSPLLRGLEYSPRLAARVHPSSGRQEYWAIRPQEFEATIYLSIEPSLELRQHPGVFQWQEIIKYGDMEEYLWATHATPYCNHPRVSEPGPTKLGNDAVALLGFNGEYETFEGTKDNSPEKILIYLSRGDARIRWLAILHACLVRQEPVSREIMLRTDGCCDACALEHTASLPGRWTLIL